LHPIRKHGYFYDGFSKVQALFQKLTGKANKVSPDDKDSSSSSDEAEETPDKPERSFWSDSDYSTDHSHRSSSAGEKNVELASGGRSPSSTEGEGTRHRATPNPLLLAFPLRSDKEVAEGSPEGGRGSGSDPSSRESDQDIFLERPLSPQGNKKVM
jgi:hypothetical protein